MNKAVTELFKSKLKNTKLEDYPVDTENFQCYRNFCKYVKEFSGKRCSGQQ